MLDKYQIENWETGDQIMDVVEERMERGVPFQREVMAGELRLFVMAALHWRRVAINLWEEKSQADKDAMSLGPVPAKYAVEAEQ